MNIHGGDIYRNHVKMDFSINVNPLGTPESVKEALHKAVGMCGGYPDMEAEKLKNAVSAMLTVPKEYLLFGNGASELLMAAAHGIRPKKTVIPVPSFYGYEYAVKSVESEIIYYETKQENNFCITEDFNMVLTEDVELLFLGNPNNPTGSLLDMEACITLLRHCKDKGIYVVLDECFIEFSGSGFSMISEIGEFDNLIIIRAFTKLFSIPGVRLGYCICRNHSLLTKMAKQIPEWNLSCFAQEAGYVCAMQTDFIRETENYIEKERRFLECGLKQCGFLTFPSMANFFLIYEEENLYEQLLKKGILIRDCKNFRGLHCGFYRIAVKSRKENEFLLEAIERLRECSIPK